MIVGIRAPANGSEAPGALTALYFGGQGARTAARLIRAGRQNVLLRSARIRQDGSNARSTDQPARSGCPEIGIRRRRTGDAGPLVLQPNGHFPPVPGGITQFEAAPDYHPSSIMSLHSTCKGAEALVEEPTHSGRSSEMSYSRAAKILGKSESALSPRHAGRGEYAECLLLSCPACVLAGNCGHYHRDNFLDSYIELMTAEPPQHPDTYAESYHRGFLPTWTRAVRLINAVR